MGRWAFAHGFDQSFGLTISVVLKIAGLPEPSKHKPSDTIPLLFSEISMESLDEVTKRAEVTESFRTRPLLAGCPWQKGS